MRIVWWLLVAGVALTALFAAPVGAQEAVGDETLSQAPVLEAQAVLARTLPAGGEARLMLLAEQAQAAQQLAHRAHQIALMRQLVGEGRGHADWPVWVRNYLSAEFIWGRGSVALDACEAWVRDEALPLGLRASVALRQTYMAAQEGELPLTLNHWRRAQGLVAAFRSSGQEPQAAETFLGVEALQVRAEVERLEGRLDASVTTVREAIVEAQGLQAHFLHERMANPRHPDVARAANWLDGSRGMLVYALVRQGRAAEALLLADEHVRRTRRDAVAARLVRWHYRQAHALNALQRHADALTAADAALHLLAQTQASASSHTGHLALSERLRALMGLRRWAEADAAYQTHLVAVADDRLALARARSPTLAALLAAQAGRVEEALELSERSLRYRERLYGSDHPSSQEMAGVRGLVRLASGDTRGALSDFERLFVATLDRPSGWLDLEQRGHRGFVLGLLFDTYLRHVAAQPAPDAQRIERALQIADRIKLGSTQRALLDAGSRLRARSPALREALEAEQVARQAQEQQFETLQALLADEDARRRHMVTPAFKELPADQRKAQREALDALRQRIHAQQTHASAARAALQVQRERLATQHPRYADLVSPTLPGTEALSRWLRRGEALLVVHALEPATLVWLLRPGQPALLRVLPLGEAVLAEQVRVWRAALDRSDQLPVRADLAAVAGPAHALHEQLLGAWRAELSDVDSLLVASSGPLARVPLAALLRAPWQPGQAPAWLLRDMAVTQLPAAASLQALRRDEAGPPPPRALLGFGDPLFAPVSDAGPKLVVNTVPNTASRATPMAGVAKSRATKPVHRMPSRLRSNALRWDEHRGMQYAEVPPLPDTRTELVAIAKALGADPRTDLRLGREATRAAVLTTDLSDRRVVAFATHGLLPGELPGLSKPALAMAADGDASPLLELDDVLTLKLRAHWVLLSACNTAAAESGARAAEQGAPASTPPAAETLPLQAGAQGEQAMSGLVRGFFFAGARSVLATHWAVESESAAALSAAVFSAPAPSRAQALRRAQLRLADGSRWAHPYFWAGYALFGDP